MRVPRARLMRGVAQRPPCGLLWVLAGALLLAGCTTTIAGRAAPPPLVIPEPGDTAGSTGTPTAAPTNVSHPPSPPRHASFGAVRGTVSYDVPAGWTVDNAAQSPCVHPDDATSCTLRVIDVLGAHAQVAREPDPTRQDGWWLGSGPPTCAGAPHVPVTGSQVVVSSFVKMRNKTSAYGVWRVQCADPKLNFSPRLWWLPRTKVAFLQEHGGGPVDAQVDKIIASVSVT